jgi:hypothetical protein
MPVIVIGADTAVGAAIVAALEPASGEIRVFVTDPGRGEQYRNVSKVAVGDLSDGSHVGGAAIGAFCAIAITAAASDGRERYFAADPAAVLAQWADGLSDAGVGRVITVGRADDLPHPNPLALVAAQHGFVDTSGKDIGAIAAEVARLESAASL